jgi:hypothetical protein
MAIMNAGGFECIASCLHGLLLVPNIISVLESQPVDWNHFSSPHRMDMDQIFVHTASDRSSLDMSYDWGVDV